MPASTFTLTLPHTARTYIFQYITAPDYVYLQEAGGSILTSGPVSEGGGIGQFTANSAFLTAINEEVPFTYFAYENDCTDPKLANYTILMNSIQFRITGSILDTYTIPVSITNLMPISPLIPKYSATPPGPRRPK